MVASILVMGVYAFDKSGTYTDALTEGANEATFYIEDGYFCCTDYQIYYVSLNESQNIELTLTVPEEADFDLLLCTEDEEQFWYSVTDANGTNEELNLTIPETGTYMFIATCWKGSGDFTLDWKTVNADSSESIPTYLILGIVAAIAVILVAVILIMRRRSNVPEPTQTDDTQPPEPETTPESTTTL